MWKVLLIIMRATDGKSVEEHRLRTGERVQGTVSGEATNNQPKETNQ
jgi:hypothetical protein